MRRFFFSVFGAFILALPKVTLALSTPFVPLADYSGSPQLNTVMTSNSLPQYLNALFQFSLSIGAILAVVMIVWGGYLYMSSDIWNKKALAKQKITDAVIGLLLLLAIYLILYQINPDILNLNITFSQSNSSTSQTTAPAGTNGASQGHCPTGAPVNADGSCPTIFQTPANPNQSDANVPPF